MDPLDIGITTTESLHLGQRHAITHDESSPSLTFLKQKILWYRDWDTRSLRLLCLALQNTCSEKASCCRLENYLENSCVTLAMGQGDETRHTSMQSECPCLHKVPSLISCSMRSLLTDVLSTDETIQGVPCTPGRLKEAAQEWQWSKSRSFRSPEWDTSGKGMSEYAVLQKTMTTTNDLEKVRSRDCSSPEEVGETASEQKTSQDMSVKTASTQNASQDMSVRTVSTQNASQDMSVKIASERNTSQDMSVKTASEQNASQDMSVKTASEQNTSQDMSVKIASERNTSQDMSVKIASERNTSQDMSVKIASERNSSQDMSVKTASEQNTSQEVTLETLSQSLETVSQQTMSKDMLMETVSWQSTSQDMLLHTVSEAITSQDISEKTVSEETMSQDNMTVEILSEQMASPDSSLETMSEQITTQDMSALIASEQNTSQDTSYQKYSQDSSLEIPSDQQTSQDIPSPDNVPTTPQEMAPEDAISDMVTETMTFCRVCESCHPQLSDVYWPCEVTWSPYSDCSEELALCTAESPSYSADISAAAESSTVTSGNPYSDISEECTSYGSPATSLNVSAQCSKFSSLSTSENSEETGSSTVGSPSTPLHISAECSQCSRLSSETSEETVSSTVVSHSTSLDKSGESISSSIFCPATFTDISEASDTSKESVSSSSLSLANSPEKVTKTRRMSSKSVSAVTISPERVTKDIPFKTMSPVTSPAMSTETVARRTALSDHMHVENMQTETSSHNITSKGNTSSNSFTKTVSLQSVSEGTATDTDNLMYAMIPEYKTLDAGQVNEAETGKETELRPTTYLKTHSNKTLRGASYRIEGPKGSFQQRVYNRSPISKVYKFQSYENYEEVLENELQKSPQKERLLRLKSMALLEENFKNLLNMKEYLMELLTKNRDNLVLFWKCVHTDENLHKEIVTTNDKLADFRSMFETLLQKTKMELDLQTSGIDSQHSTSALRGYNHSATTCTGHEKRIGSCSGKDNLDGYQGMWQAHQTRGEHLGDHASATASQSEGIQSSLELEAQRTVKKFGDSSMEQHNAYSVETLPTFLTDMSISEVQLFQFELLQILQRDEFVQSNLTANLERTQKKLKDTKEKLKQFLTENLHDPVVVHDCINTLDLLDENLLKTKSSLAVPFRSVLFCKELNRAFRETEQMEESEISDVATDNLIQRQCYDNLIQRQCQRECLMLPTGLEDESNSPMPENSTLHTDENASQRNLPERKEGNRHIGRIINKENLWRFFQNACNRIMSSSQSEQQNNQLASPKQYGTDSLLPEHFGERIITSGIKENLMPSDDAVIPTYTLQPDRPKVSIWSSLSTAHVDVIKKPSQGTCRQTSENEKGVTEPEPTDLSEQFPADSMFPWMDVDQKQMEIARRHSKDKLQQTQGKQKQVEIPLYIHPVENVKLKESYKELLQPEALVTQRRTSPSLRHAFSKRLMSFKKRAQSFNSSDDSDLDDVSQSFCQTSSKKQCVFRNTTDTTVSDSNESTVTPSTLAPYQDENTSAEQKQDRNKRPAGNMMSHGTDNDEPVAKKTCLSDTSRVTNTGHWTNISTDVITVSPQPEQN